MRRGVRSSMMVAVLFASVVAGTAQARTTLDYVGNFSAAPAEAFNKFTAATGGTLVNQPDALPLDITSYACVMLNLNTETFNFGQKAQLKTYVQQGGTVIAVAEFSQFQGGTVRGVMNDIATYMAGATTMVINDSPADAGNTHTTTNILGDVYTTGVASVDYAGTSTLTVASPARTLINDTAGAPIVAAQAIGGGTFVLVGDANMLDDSPGSGYTAGDTDVLVRRLCGDTSPPAITITTPAPAARYRVNQAVPSSYSCTDPDGPSDLLAPGFCTGPVGNGAGVPTGTAGNFNFTVNGSDKAGNTATATNAYVVDASPPAVTITVPADGATYPRQSALLSDYGCTDPDGAGDVATCVGTAALGAQADTTVTGAHTFTVTGTDIAGNSAVKTISYTVQDTSPPAVTITSPASGSRYKRGATVNSAYTCTDPDGFADLIAPGGFCTGPVVSGTPFDTAVGGNFSFVVNASDKAGNLAQASAPYFVDGSPPDITITVPAEGGRYARGAAVKADYGCTDPDGVPDVKTCTSLINVGALIDTSASGPKSLVANASDQVGNTATKTVNYVVVGSNPPTVTITSPKDNASFNVGEAIPLSYACADPDGQADIKTCQRVGGATGALDSKTAGSFTVVAEAIDQADNRGTATVHYTVVGKPAAGTAPTTTKSPKVCKSRRSFKVRVHQSRKIKVVSATIFVNGKKQKAKKGKRFTGTVTLVGLKKGQYKVVIKVKLSNGKTITDTRRFKTCTPKGK